MSVAVEHPARPCPDAPRHRLVGLEQRVRARFEETGVPSGGTVLVGFSGGGDSLALGGVLARIAPIWRVEVVAVHVDHRLRPDSGEEQQRAGELASAIGVPFRAMRVPVDVRARHPGVGLEEAARRERYRLFALAAGETGAALIALAHHETDQVETVLLHLLRGSGLDGVLGMGERTTVAVPWWGEEPAGDSIPLGLWRPFIFESKATVRAYAANLRLAPVVDPSNEDRTFRRNAVRHEVLPVLERVSQGSVAAIARFGRLVADDAVALDQIGWEAYRRCLVGGALSRAGLGGEPRVAIARRIVRLWVRERTGGSSPPADRVEAILKLVGGRDAGRRVEIGQHLIVRAAGDVLVIESMGERAAAAVVEKGLEGR